MKQVSDEIWTGANLASSLASKLPCSCLPNPAEIYSHQVATVCVIQLISAIS
jgi:hypothetical protein